MRVMVMKQEQFNTTDRQVSFPHYTKTGQHNSQPFKVKKKIENLNNRRLKRFLDKFSPSSYVLNYLSIGQNWGKDPVNLRVICKETEGSNYSEWSILHQNRSNWSCDHSDQTLSHGQLIAYLKEHLKYCS